MTTRCEMKSPISRDKIGGLIVAATLGTILLLPILVPKKGLQEPEPTADLAPPDSYEECRKHSYARHDKCVRDKWTEVDYSSWMLGCANMLNKDIDTCKSAFPHVGMSEEKEDDDGM